MGDEGNEGDEGEGRDEGCEGDEGEEERRTDVEGRSCGGACGTDGSEKVRLLEACHRPCGDWRQGGERHGVVHSPRTVQDQDQGEAGDEGREEDDVRQGG